MSGITLLLETALEYERTHQLVLYTLFKNSDLAVHLLRDESKFKKVEFEPTKGLFDLAVSTDGNKHFIEIKLYSSLGKNQLKRQIEHITKQPTVPAWGVYILLGTSWFENTDDALSVNKARKIGYIELIKALDKVIFSPRPLSDAKEMSLAYRESLRKQWDRLLNAADNLKNRNTIEMAKIYYYSLYYKLQQQLGQTKTDIYTVAHPGGEVRILHRKAAATRISGVDIDLYCELVEGKLCIKFHSPGTSKDKKRVVRDVIRDAIQNELKGSYELLKTGRLGEAMTAYKIVHDFCDLERLDKSAAIFKDVGGRLDQIARSLNS